MASKESNIYTKENIKKYLVEYIKTSNDPIRAIENINKLSDRLLLLSNDIKDIDNKHRKQNLPDKEKIEIFNKILEKHKKALREQKA